MNRPRGKPFEPGNKMGRGRPKGSRNKRAAEVQAILDQYAPAIVMKTVRTALEGNVRAQELCMDRILAPLREPCVRIKLPKLKEIPDIDLAEQRLIDAIAKGDITPAEGEKLHAILQAHYENREGRALTDSIINLEKVVEQLNPKDS